MFSFIELFTAQRYAKPIREFVRLISIAHDEEAREEIALRSGGGVIPPGEVAQKTG